MARRVAPARMRARLASWSCMSLRRRLTVRRLHVGRQAEIGPISCGSRGGEKKIYSIGQKLTINRADGCCGAFARSFAATYQHVSELHLGRYLAEFDFLRLLGMASDGDDTFEPSPDIRTKPDLILRKLWSSGHVETKHLASAPIRGLERFVAQVSRPRATGRLG